VAVITGSTRGIGRAIAERYAVEGASVIVNSRTEAAAREAAAAIGGGAVGLAGDVATEDGCRSLIEGALRVAGRIDILVNNAGTSIVAKAEELRLEDWRRVFDLNLTGAFLCAQLAGREMLAQGSGCVINIGSVAAFTSTPGRVAYCASKAGLVMMTKVMAAEWAPTVRVNAVLPGFIETDLVAELERNGSLDGAALRRRTPFGRLGRAEEVAAAASFLASDDASYVTGDLLAVDGGWLAYGFV
jgi:NAD(P)-dependent dehydrogenase (short-subunit alcohol dehydrogenase family)